MGLPGEGSRGQRGRTVLLVEDDPDVRDVLEDELEDGGYNVIPAANGKQALDFLTLNRPEKADVVILDLMMPMVSGWEVLDQMHADPQLAEIPVIVLSAMSLDRPDPQGGKQRRQRPTTVNVRQFIPKPFSLRQIFDALSGVFGPGRVEQTP
ncbi:MAG TPA: response regulator [Polyangia bacterium]|nr:response regulator [Polyangia bacterium]